MKKIIDFINNRVLHDHSMHLGQESTHSHSHDEQHQNGATEISPELKKVYKKVLIIALALNAAMFLAQIFFSWLSGSATLLADAGDFLSDSLNYVVSIFVIGSAPILIYRANLVKIASMLLISFSVLFFSIYKILFLSQIPTVQVMFFAAALAFFVNLFCVYLLSAHKADANMYAAWACSVNDMAGNALVFIVAIATVIFGSYIPDIIVAIGMSIIAIITSIKIWQKTKNIKI